MKILIKDGVNNLVWKDAVYKDRKFYSTEENWCRELYDIYSVKDDNRNKIVVCSYCGKEIPNTPSAIKAHQNMVNRSNKCFECDYLRHRNSTVVSQKYVLNDDGTYTESTKRNVNLCCNITWSYHDINSDAAKRNCKYARCETAEFRHIEDFWTRYPGAFDEFITIDRVLDGGYKNIHKSTNEIDIVLNGKVNLTAIINNQGICYEFLLHYRKRYYILRYSKKYNKAWIISYGFKELSSVDISEFAEGNIIKKLSSLYE